MTQKIKKRNKRKIPAPWLIDASNQGGLWFYNFRQRARSQALFRGPRALWSMRGPPKEKGVHFKILSYVVLSFCCIAAEKKIFSSGGQKNHPKLLVYMKTKRSRHLQPLKATTIGVLCSDPHPSCHSKLNIRKKCHFRKVSREWIKSKIFNLKTLIF